MKVAALAGLATIAFSATALGAHRPTGAVETCSGQSGASFPHAFTDRDNLAVGPLALIGAGRLTDAQTVRRFHGNKFPAVVAAGHRVTIELTRSTRRFASLGWGPLPQGSALTARDGHRVVTFRSCGRDHAASDADGRPVTFWSGFVLASRPGCVPLRIWVDREPAPRRARIALGRSC